MMGFIWRACRHARLSFPMSPRARPEQVLNEMPHVTCLDCGREFWYDWSRMRLSRERVQAAAPKRDAA